jgi:type IV secretion system protein VirD4
MDNTTNKKKVPGIKAAAVTGIALIALVIVAAALSFLSGDPLAEWLGKWQLWTAWGALIIIAGVYFVADYNVRASRRVLKVNPDGEDAHWLTSKEIKGNAGLTVALLSELDSVADGVPIYAERVKDDIKVILAKTIHTLVIGTTGSGKTTTFVSPTVEILSRTKNKPGMVITDPKGELYRLHSAGLRARGYSTPLIDLTDMYHSTRVNPFRDIWVKTDRMRDAQAAVIAYDRGKYLFDGKEYPTEDAAERERQLYIRQLNDEIFVDLQDLIYTVCPVENKMDATWQKGARDLILALAIGFWEDVRDGLMPEAKFNLFNLYKNIADYCVGECEQLKAYFERRDKFSKTHAFSNTVLVSQDRTLTSYMGDVNQYFAWMADTGISALTSATDIDLGKFDEQPAALFIKIPEERENRHKLVTLLMTQMYKGLVAKAADNLREGKTKDAELLRNVYFIMDEFGNLPKFYNIDKIITVGRSRKIFMLPIIQDFKQLENKYGKEIAAIVKSNCPIKVFIQAADNETTKEFSELCGKHKVKNISFSERNDTSVSTGVTEKPLVTPNELQNLNDASAGRMGNAVVLAAGKHPLRATFTPLFRAKEVYALKDFAGETPPVNPFEEEEYYYDIAKRNIFLEEQDKFERAADAFADALFAEFGEVEEAEGEEGNNEDERDRAARERAERRARLIDGVYKSIDKRITAKLSMQLPQDVLTRLMSLPLEDKLVLIEELLDKATRQHNNFLMFDLVSIKHYIKDSIKNYSLGNDARGAA